MIDLPPTNAVAPTATESDFTKSRRSMTLIENLPFIPSFSTAVHDFRISALYRSGRFLASAILIPAHGRSGDAGAPVTVALPLPGWRVELEIATATKKACLGVRLRKKNLPGSARQAFLGVPGCFTARPRSPRP